MQTFKNCSVLNMSYSEMFCAVKTSAVQREFIRTQHQHLHVVASSIAKLPESRWCFCFGYDGRRMLHG